MRSQIVLLSPHRQRYRPIVSDPTGAAHSIEPPPLVSHGACTNSSPLRILLIFFGCLIFAFFYVFFFIPETKGICELVVAARMRHGGHWRSFACLPANGRATVSLVTVILRIFIRAVLLGPPDFSSTLSSPPTTVPPSLSFSPTLPLCAPTSS
jgi:hypothetical protein